MLQQTHRTHSTYVQCVLGRDDVISIKWSSDRYHWYLSDIYLISIKQEINVDFLCCMDYHSGDAALCCCAVAFWSLCSSIELFNFCFPCFKMPGGQKLGEKLEKTPRFATVHWFDELMWPGFLSWFCFVLALRKKWRFQRFHRFQKSDRYQDFKKSWYLASLVLGSV